MQIAVTARASNEARAALRRRFPRHDFVFSQEALAASAREIAVWVTFGGDVNEEALRHMPSLRWLQMLTAGVDDLPFPHLKEQGVLVTNTRGMHTVQMSECALLAMLQLARKAADFFRAQQEGHWQPKISREFVELHGKTLGIAGLGAIGLGVARRAKAFGMRVVALKRRGDPPPESVDELLTPGDKDKLLRQSDFLVLILPLTPETRHFIGRPELAIMKPSAYLVNIGRGALIDEDALVQALTAGQIAGAGLDVFAEEPLPSDSPLWAMDNVIITPHIGGNSPHYMERALDIFAENLQAYPDRDQMVHIVDLDRQY